MSYFEFSFSIYFILLLLKLLYIGSLERMLSNHVQSMFEYLAPRRGAGNHGQQPGQRSDPSQESMELEDALEEDKEGEEDRCAFI